MQNRLQDSIDARGGLIQLQPDEYQGPLVVRRPCTIDGRGSTVWDESGPVVRVQSPGVTLRNLRIETTGIGTVDIALQCDRSDTVLENVEVYGSVIGVDGEEGAPLPRTIDLGTFAAGHQNVFVRRLTLPAPMQVEADLAGIQVDPKQLRSGQAELRIVTGELAPGTSVYGEIFLSSAVRRRIYVRGRAEAGAPVAQEAPLPSAPPSRRPAPVQSAPAAHAGSNLRKGERRGLPSRGTVEIRLSGVPAAGADTYGFCLAEGNRVRGDQDLIFFGQPHSADGALQLLPEGAALRVDLGKIDPQIQRLIVAFSAYEGTIPAGTPAVNVTVGGERFTYPLKDLRGTRTVTAVHLYRRDGGWKIWVADHRSDAGIEALCALYGVEVA